MLSCDNSDFYIFKGCWSSIGKEGVSLIGSLGSSSKSISPLVCFTSPFSSKDLESFLIDKFVVLLSGAKV